MGDIYRYGEHPSNFTRIYLPRGPECRGTVAVLHGGWWRSRFDLHLMDGLCETLADDGWRVENVEFRRTGAGGADEGGWPRTFDDVETALRRRAPVPDGLPTIAIGHSAGGQLALLAAAAGLVDGAVGIAPISDLERSQREGLGEGATEDFIGAGLMQATDLYAAASPLAHLPLGRPQLIVHGVEDQRVPIEHSRDYADRARRAGDPIELAEFQDTDHFQVIDPDHRSWGHVRTWIRGVSPH